MTPQLNNLLQNARVHLEAVRSKIPRHWTDAQVAIDTCESDLIVIRRVLNLPAPGSPNSMT